MNRKTLGLVLMVVGGLAIVVALIGLLGGSDDNVESVAASTTAPSTITTATSSTQAPTTTEPSTTKPTTTTTEPTTTTEAPAIDPADAITAFVTSFVAMIDAGDAQGLFESLHPSVTANQDADLCQAFIEREILALVDYRLTGDITGPLATRYGEFEVDIYTAPVAFTFQGAAFDGEATFAIEDGEVRWFTTCR